MARVLAVPWTRDRTDDAALDLAWVRLVVVGAAWWSVGYRLFVSAGLDAIPGVTPVLTHGVILAGVAGHFATWALEATFYWCWWRSWGERFSYAGLFSWIATYSLLDAASLTLHDLAAGAPVARWLVPLGGVWLLKAPHPEWGGVVFAAFGTTGLLAIARIALTARTQARALGRPLTGPLVLTAAAWLSTRLLSAFASDLVRGMSPMP